MRSLQEWMKYLEQQEQSVKQQPEEEEAPPAPVQTVPVWETVAVVDPPRPVMPEAPKPVAPQPVQPIVETIAVPVTPPPASVQPPPPKLEVPVQSQPAVQPTAPKPAAVIPAPAVPKPSKPAKPRVRSKGKPAPKPVLVENIDPDETAQKSYKPFKESREQLLHRLLDPMISLEEAARILNVCPTTVRRYTNRGALPHYRTAGNQRRFRLSDVLAFVGSDESGQMVDD